MLKFWNALNIRVQSGLVVLLIAILVISVSFYFRASCKAGKSSVTGAVQDSTSVAADRFKDLSYRQAWLARNAPDAYVGGMDLLYARCGEPARAACSGGSDPAKNAECAARSAPADCAARLQRVIEFFKRHDAEWKRAVQ